MDKIGNLCEGIFAVEVVDKIKVQNGFVGIVKDVNNRQYSTKDVFKIGSFVIVSGNLADHVIVNGIALVSDYHIYGEYNV